MMEPISVTSLKEHAVNKSSILEGNSDLPRDDSEVQLAASLGANACVPRMSFLKHEKQD